MSFGEHVLDLFAGPDIPFRNIMLPHSSLPLVPEPLSFSHALHDRKCKAALHSHTDQIDHNIVSGTDRCGNGSLSFLDQSLGISQPYVRTMSKSRDPDQIRKILWLGINKHLHGKVCTKLRHTQTAKLAPSNILRSDAQSFCAGKKGHNLFAVKRDLLGILFGQILQHTDHGRIIVSQNIKLQKVSVNGMIVKMRGNDVAVFVICRMLYRCEFFDFLAFWQNNDSSRVLACGTPNACASLNYPVDLAVPLVLTMLFKIIFHIAESCFFRKSTDGSRLKGLPFSKNNLCVFMGVCLIFTGKVKVNIRLLVSLKAQEGFKWNVKAFFDHFCAAVRAVFVRHVTACHSAEFFYLR